MEQLIGLGDLSGQCGSHSIHQLNGILLIDQPTATEGNATALEKNILQLIQMIEDNQASVAHVTGVGKPN